MKLPSKVLLAALLAAVTGSAAYLIFSARRARDRKALHARAMFMSSHPNLARRAVPEQMALIVPDIPLSFSFTETRHQANGNVTLTGMTYRDARGRIRTDEIVRDLSNVSTRTTTIIDPIQGTETTIFPADKEAYRFPHARGYHPNPVLGVVTAIAYAANGKTPPKNLWITSRQPLGTRKVGIADYKGTRFLLSLNTDAMLVKPQSASVPMSVDRWFSDSQKLFSVIDRKSQDQTQRTEINDLRMGEPDATLFTVSADYRLLVP